MKKIGIITISFISFMFLFAGTGFSGGMTKTEEGGQKAVTSGESITVDKLTGMDVRNREGKKIGEVSSSQLDEKGNVRFLVVSTGGILGVGEKERIVPYSAFKPAEGANALILTVDENLLASSPAKTPDMTEEQFNRKLYEHYGQAPRWGTEREAIPKAAPEKY